MNSHVWRIFLAFMIWAAVSLPSAAQPPSQLLRGLGIPAGQNGLTPAQQLQTQLSWTGHFRGEIDGVSGTATTNAVRQFQRSLGEPATGTLSARQRTRLQERAGQTERGYGFSNRLIDWTGARADLPLALLTRPKVSGDDFESVVYDSPHTTGLSLSFWANQDFNISPSNFRSAQIDVYETASETMKVLASGTSSTGVYVMLTYDKRTAVIIAQRRGSEWRRLTIRLSSGDFDGFRPMVNRVMRSLDLFASNGVPENQRITSIRLGKYPGADDVPDWYKTMIANGSGSIVSRQGHVLTNHHVVDMCGRLTVNGAPAILHGSDIRLDLALLQAPTLRDRTPVRFRTANPKLGESVSVMGYPLFSVSQSLNFTNGIVSSTVGYLGDRSGVQVTAPIQPGNSGGPVLDANGTQVAVVASKPSVALKNTSNVENVGWVIRGRQAVLFLERYGVKPILETRAPRGTSPPPEDVSRWRQFTVRIECHKN